MPDSSADSCRPAAPRQFASTHWSVVLAAGRDSTPQSAEALTALCHAYWYPLYAFVRRGGYQAADAQDLTQAFFADLFKRAPHLAADPDKGRFRTFLLTLLKRFLADEHQRRRAQKRGAGRPTLPLDFDDGERKFQLEPAGQETAETIFERRWALTLLDRVLKQLGEQYREQGQSDQFDCLHVYLVAGDDGPAYREAAERLQLSESGVKVAVHRMRQKYRDLLQREVATTVNDPQEVGLELAELLQALRKP